VFGVCICCCCEHIQKQSLIQGGEKAECSQLRPEGINFSIRRQGRQLGDKGEMVDSWPCKGVKLLPFSKPASSRNLAVCLSKVLYYNYVLTDKKSLVAFKCLIYVLQSPSQKGLKRARMEPAAGVKEFFCDFEVRAQRFIE
jgi:hypothetical protein